MHQIRLNIAFMSSFYSSFLVLTASIIKIKLRKKTEIKFNEKQEVLEYEPPLFNLDQSTREKVKLSLGSSTTIDY